MIIIVDYGLGNPASLKNMLRKAGHSSTITGDPEEISKAARLILPGVGAFDTGMRKLRELGLEEILNHKVLVEKIPVLGICLGAHLMTSGSEEGILPGLSWIHAETVKFNLPRDGKLKVPHMGWNEIEWKKEHVISRDIPLPSRFYFVHSYHLKCHRPEQVLAVAEYGYSFVCGFSHENISGVQFHPEKSHKFGMKLLSNFAT